MGTLLRIVEYDRNKYEYSNVMRCVWGLRIDESERYTVWNEVQQCIEM